MNVYCYIKDMYFVLKCDKDKEGRIILYYIVCGGNINIFEDLFKGFEKYGLKIFYVFEWVKKEFKKLYKINFLYIFCLYGYE